MITKQVALDLLSRTGAWVVAAIPVTDGYQIIVEEQDGLEPIPGLTGEITSNLNEDSTASVLSAVVDGKKRVLNIKGAGL